MCERYCARRFRFPRRFKFHLYECCLAAVRISIKETDSLGGGNVDGKFRQELMRLNQAQTRTWGDQAQGVKGDAVVAAQRVANRNTKDHSSAPLRAVEQRTRGIAQLNNDRHLSN